LSLYPQAREGGGSLLVRRTAEPGGGPPDPARSAAEAGRRARGKIRRYCAANLLNRFGTLTYAGEGCHDPVSLRADLAVFFKRLRAELGGEPLPYLWVPEWHPGGHGLHAHFAVGRFVPRSLIDGAWGHGFIKIKLIGDLPVESGQLAEARVAARYLSKYASKDFGEGQLDGLHRYEVAGIPAGQARLRRGVRRGGHRAGLQLPGSATGTGVAVVECGGVAWPARLLGAVGLTTT
jgi:hypothetical protein